jgi:hypothetical protein
MNPATLLTRCGIRYLRQRRAGLAHEMPPDIAACIQQAIQFIFEED